MQGIHPSLSLPPRDDLTGDSQPERLGPEEEDWPAVSYVHTLWARQPQPCQPSPQAGSQSSGKPLMSSTVGPPGHFSTSRCDQGWAGVFGLRQRKAVGPQDLWGPSPHLDTPPLSLHMHPRVTLWLLWGPGRPQPLRTRNPISLRPAPRVYSMAAPEGGLKLCAGLNGGQLHGGVCVCWGV